MKSATKKNNILKGLGFIFSIAALWVLFSSFTSNKNSKKTTEAFIIDNSKIKFCSPKIENRNVEKVVKWTVEEDITSLYVIERSNDGYVFKMVGYTPAVSQDKKVSYEFVDKNPSSTEPYYRVTKINKDKTVYFSTIEK